MSRVVIINNMLHQVKSYSIHLLKAFHLHGIHSPFVFNFQKHCIQDPTPYKAYDLLANYRRTLAADDRSLKIEDYGAGSKRMKGKQRKISEILKNNVTTPKRSQLMYRMARYFEVNRVLELGTSLGLATHAIACARPKASITTVEGAPEVAQFTKQQLAEFHCEHVEVLPATFDDFLKGNADSAPSGTYDLIFMDGHHDGQATLDYFEKLLAFTHNDSIVVLDDIYWSKDMTAAWDRLTKHPQVTASIDGFFWGFLFFRKEQFQERFHLHM